MKRLITSFPIFLLIFFIWTSDIHARRPIRDYFDTPLTTAGDTLIKITATTPSALHKALEIRASAASTKSNKGKDSNSYGIAFAINDSTGEYYSATLTPDSDSDNNDIYNTKRSATFTIACRRDNRPDSIILTRKLTDGIETQRLENTMAVEINCQTGDVDILAGYRNAIPLTSIKLSPEQVKNPMGIIARGTPTFSVIVSEYIPDPLTMTATNHTVQSIAERLSSPTVSLHPLEGYWKYLDRETDPLYTSSGGQYTLAVIANPDSDKLDIIYISGAQINASRWTPGMKKGELRPTQFKDVYDLEWYDAEMKIVNDESNARVEVGGEVLSLEFPLLKAKMRFARLPGHLF